MKLNSWSFHKPFLSDFQSLPLIAINLSALVTSPSLTHFIHSVTKFFYFYFTHRDEQGDILRYESSISHACFPHYPENFWCSLSLWWGLIRSDSRIRCLSLKSQYILYPDSWDKVLKVKAFPYWIGAFFFFFLKRFWLLGEQGPDWDTHSMKFIPLRIEKERRHDDLMIPSKSLTRWCEQTYEEYV